MPICGYLNWLFALDRSPKGEHASFCANDPKNCKRCGAGRCQRMEEDGNSAPDMMRRKGDRIPSEQENDGRFRSPEDFVRAIDESQVSAEFKEQMRRVVKSVTGKDGGFADGFRKAPNGKPSRLDDWLWVVVRTPAFKEWFGDWELCVGAKADGKDIPSDSASKVVDDNGEPKICYHSTDADFERFDLDRFGSTDPGYYGVALYFSPHEQRQYGSRMIGVFLNCRRMVDFSDSDSMTGEQWDDYMAFQKEHVRILQSNESDRITNGMRKSMVKVSREFTKRMEKDGIDGFTANYGLEIGVYSPSQVMIVTDERKQKPN